MERVFYNHALQVNIYNYITENYGREWEVLRNQLRDSEEKRILLTALFDERNICSDFANYEEFVKNINEQVVKKLALSK